MSIYTYAYELEGKILEEGDTIEFSGGLIAETLHNSSGWWLSISGHNNKEVFSRLYGYGISHEKRVELTKELGGDPVSTISGDFPYQKTAEGLTNVTIGLLTKQEQNKLDGFNFNKFHPDNQLKGVHSDIIRKLCLNQVKQGNRFDPEIFDRDIRAGSFNGGMDWACSIEGYDYWNEIVSAHEKETGASVPIPINDKKNSSLALLTGKKKKSVLYTL